MQIEIFTICDSAQVYSGKAVIVGAFNHITTKTLPLRVPTLTLAVRVAFEKHEFGDKTFFFKLKNPDGSFLISELKCDVKQIKPIENNEELTTIDMNLGLGTVLLNQYGVYTVTMVYNDDEYHLKFFVRQG